MVIKLVLEIKAIRESFITNKNLLDQLRAFTTVLELCEIQPSLCMNARFGLTF